MDLNDFDIENFLDTYWQKKPLLIRNPWDNWRNPLNPDELAGMACEEEVESRLIVQNDGNWKVENGPLSESRFGELDDKDWTLLAQAVDHFIPDVAALIEPFRFIPNWRIDDVMVSYAADGGGVGPHFDQYDVFLIQGLGKRRWQLGAKCDDNAGLLPHDDLRQLAEFEATMEYICQPGDILYVPPGIAHNGVAIGDDCMTYSIGFRAPSRSELIGYWVDDMLTEMSDDDRYSDPALQKQSNSGEISDDAIDKLHSLITEKMGDRNRFARWFGQYVSTPKYPEVDWRPEPGISVEELMKSSTADSFIERNPASRFSFIRNGSNTLLLFVDGNCFECTDQTAQFAEQICNNRKILVDHDFRTSDNVIRLITALYHQGSVMIESDTGHQQDV